jgi:hypothetical protein
MTAKEQLRELVDELSETEAARALEVLIARRGEQRDALMEFLENAPLDDEPTTPEEEAAVQEALEAAARGETITLEEFRAELDAESR